MVWFVPISAYLSYRLNKVVSVHFSMGKRKAKNSPKSVIIRLAALRLFCAAQIVEQNAENKFITIFIKTRLTS